MPRRPPTPATTEEQLQAVTVGELEPRKAPIELVEYDKRWPVQFGRAEAAIRWALGAASLLVEHVGSTSIPGLPAKPIIDILLVVNDSADEGSYAPALEAAGFTLRIREPDWHEHRMFRRRSPDINLHVFSPDSPEIRRMLAFRDHLRSNAADRDLYERTKRRLARRHWKYTQNYADAKSAVVEEIIARAS